MDTCSKRKSLSHSVPLIIKMAFQPGAPKAFKTTWPHHFLLIRTILGSGPAEISICTKNHKKFILLVVHMTLQTSRLLFVPSQLNLCSIKSHQTWEGRERGLLITCWWHLGRGFPCWTWLKIISKSEFPQSHIVLHHSYLPSPLPIRPLPSLSATPHLAGDTLQVVGYLIQGKMNTKTSALGLTNIVARRRKSLQS